MSLKMLRLLVPPMTLILITILACNLPGGVAQQSQPDESVTQPASIDQPPSTEIAIPETSIPVINHVMTPASPGSGKLVYDVESQSTAPEQRAKWGDSYDINRLERPFLQNMTYVPDLDIVTYTVASDNDWWYVSIKLIGTDPNNSIGINYGVELDTNHDGFGDYIIWSHPPYSPQWDTLPVQIYQDKNHDTGGLSAEKSDAPITTDGYETLIFNGGIDAADPDMAWVRINAGQDATVQFAFKRSWSGSIFMLGVLADNGLKDVGKLDYVDRFVEEEAGSPVKEKQYYPLKALYAVDNACREAFGFEPTGYEPQLCPHEEPEPTKQPKTPVPGITPPSGCQPPPLGCGANSYWVPEPDCYCSPY